MDKQSLHPGLEFRLQLLATRIANLRMRAPKQSGIEKIDAEIEIQRLEKRYEMLQERLRALDAEGAGALSHVKSAMAQIRFDFRSSIEGFVKWLDSASRPHEQRSRPQRR